MKKISLLLLLLPFCLMATDYIPWYDPSLRIHWKGDYLYQRFSKVATSKECKSYRSNDHFLSMGISGNYEGYAAELEGIFAETKHRKFGWDNYRLTGRYQFTSDDIGDDFSSIGGVTLSTVYKGAVNDIGSFHHGRFEAEAHFAFGKQIFCENFWTSRFWSVLALGTADVGSPWFRADFHWDKNFWDLHKFGLLTQTLWGVGGKSLCIGDFKGYGPLSHQSVDLGLYYSYFLDCWDAALTVQYSYRVYSKNFPQDASRILIKLTGFY